MTVGDNLSLTMTPTYCNQNLQPKLRILRLRKKEIPCLIDNFKAKQHHGAACWVAGWGATRYGGSESQNLMSVGLNLMEIDYCRSHSFYDSHILQSDELCAGLPPTEESSVNSYGEKVISSEKDSCQGSGFDFFSTQSQPGCNQNLVP